MIIKNLTKTYQGRVVLDIDEFNFEKGKIYAVVGANGSGKSTLLKCIAGIIKADAKKFMHIEDGEKIGYMPQSSFAFKMSLMNNLFVGCKKTKKTQDLAHELTDRLGLSAKVKTRGDRLSGGEKQKMALIRLLLSEYDYILLDECTSAMDAHSTAESEKIIKEYCKNGNKCCIMVTHSIKQAQRISDETVFMYEGKITERNSTSEFVTHPKTAQAKEFLEFFGA